MPQIIPYNVRNLLIKLSGACFHFWDDYYDFFINCGVSRSITKQYPRNAYNKYDVMRNILTRLEDKNDRKTLNCIISNFYRMEKAVHPEQLDKQKAKKLLTEFRGAVGSDPIEQEIKKRERKRNKAKYKSTVKEEQLRKQELEKLNKRFMDMAALKDMTKQQRGYKFEKLVFDLLEFSEFEFKPPFKNDTEQIDGHFRYQNFDYLIEARWRAEKAKQKHLAVFDGKIKGKVQSTRGLFISAEGFDDNVVNNFGGDSPRIILMDGADLVMILNGSRSFSDAMKAKIDAAVQQGKIYLSVSEIV